MLIAGRNAMLAGGGSQPSGGYWGLCFTAEEPNCVVNMSKKGTPPAVTLETSPDGMTWTLFDADGGTTPITLAAVGDKVYFRAGSGGNSQFALSNSNRHTFTITGKTAASGSIMSLLDATNEGMDSLVDCGDFTFNSLFYDCSSLTSAPSLPATVLRSGCYYAMFMRCSSLTSAPSLPATVLPTTNCCQRMFQSCSSLAEVRVAFSAWNGNATTNWLSGVAATGTFYCPTALGTDATITRGTNYCPTGWTVVNTDA